MHMYYKPYVHIMYLVYPYRYTYFKIYDIEFTQENKIYDY